MSKIVKLNAASDGATVANATIGDFFTTMLSADSALTGVYGFLQRVALLVVGMSIQSYRDGKGLLGFASLK